VPVGLEGRGLRADGVLVWFTVVCEPLYNGVNVEVFDLLEAQQVRCPYLHPLLHSCIGSSSSLRLASGKCRGGHIHRRLGGCAHWMVDVVQFLEKAGVFVDVLFDSRIERSNKALELNLKYFATYRRDTQRGYA